MIVRAAIENDISGIVQLLKLSLGNVSSIKSEQYWRWKHLDNPFGTSPVLLAEEDGQIIAVRAMMQWQWCKQDIVYKSLRAVDTATHPAHQGKGLFSKLTDKLLEQTSAEGYSFIFNTPNSKSLPGYIKMGWQLFSKAPVFMKPVFGVTRSHANSNWEAYHTTLLKADLSSDLHVSLFNDKLHTPKSKKYYHWRYQQCPFPDYGLVTGNVNRSSFGMIVKRKKRGPFFELRICDYWLEDHACFRQFVATATRAARKTGCVLLSICLNNAQRQNNFLQSGFISVQKRSPIITLKNLQEDVPSGEWNNVDNWSFQMGDLELF